MKAYRERCLTFFKLFIIGAIIATLLSCMTRQDMIARKTPEQISQWSNEYLCDYARWDNPAIKFELLKRKLFTEQEFDYVIKGDHNNFPRIGMRKCAMWTFTNGDKLIKRETLSNGIVQELWEVHSGGYFFIRSLGGHFFMITIEDDKITDVKFLK